MPPPARITGFTDSLKSFRSCSITSEGIGELVGLTAGLERKRSICFCWTSIGMSRRTGPGLPSVQAYQALSRAAGISSGISTC